MIQGPIEHYHPRTMSNLGRWPIGGCHFKIYGIAATGQSISPSLLDEAKNFIADDVIPLVRQEGEDNGLGFVIIHPGDLGVSIAAHWWIQGSVLCQHIKRVLWGADAPMDTVKRPVVACVWELEIIAAERVFWRDTMMNEHPAPDKYLSLSPV